ncbi:MAG: ABC1 kinase family protein [Pseudomonadales bacterium]
MQIIPGIDSAIADKINAAELGARGALRLSQTWLQVSPRALKWSLQRKLPPAKEVRDLFESLGATYIKFGQFIASSPSVFPREYVDEFQQLLDQTTPIPFRKIKQIIEQELGRSVDTVYQSLDPKPLASASIAQVHAGILLSGEDVVVKVQKPGVQAIITVDLHTVYIMVRLLELILPHLDHEALAGLVAEMYQSMIDECDFLKEARNLDQFRQFLQAGGNQQVVAPKPFHDASSIKVLTMERLYGRALTDRATIDDYSGAPADALFSALDTWFASLTSCEFFHADLHSGNLLLLDDNKVGFIDFGMVGRIKPTAWQAMFSLFEGLQMEDSRRVAEAMLAIGLTRQSVDIDALANSINNAFQALQSADPETLLTATLEANTEDINEVLNTLGEVAKKFGIRFPREFTLLLKQFLYFDRYVQLLAPDTDMFGDVLRSATTV